MCIGLCLLISLTKWLTKAIDRLINEEQFHQAAAANDINFLNKGKLSIVPHSL